MQHAQGQASPPRTALKYFHVSTLKTLGDINDNKSRNHPIENWWILDSFIKNIKPF
jgi:hypothetical protein